MDKLNIKRQRLAFRIGDLLNAKREPSSPIKPPYHIHIDSVSEKAVSEDCTIITVKIPNVCLEDME